MTHFFGTTSRPAPVWRIDDGSVSAPVVAIIAVLVVIASAALVAVGLRDGGGTLSAGAPKAARTTVAAPTSLSPSGLPVGVLEGKVTRTSGVVDVSTVRLLVRPDGTGSVSLGGGYLGSSGKDVEYVQLGPGRIDVAYGGVVCANPRALTLSFTVRGDTVVIDTTKLRGCFASAELVADLAGTALHVSPLPPG